MATFVFRCEKKEKKENGWKYSAKPVITRFKFTLNYKIIPIKGNEEILALHTDRSN